MPKDDTENVQWELLREHGERITKIETMMTTLTDSTKEVVAELRAMREEIHAMRPLLGLARLIGSNLVSAAVGAAVVWFIGNRG